MPRLSRSTSSRPAAALPRPRSPRQSLLRRFATNPPRGLGWALTIGLFASSGYYGTAVGGEWPRIVAQYGTPGDMLANLLGFRIETVTLTGQRELSDERVIAVAGVNATSSLPFLDVEAARENLQSLPLVKSATVHKLYPDTLAISLEERKPFALWQNEGTVSIIALDGTALDEMRDQRFANLPFVVGEGANKRAFEIVALLDAVPDIKARVRASVLVAERRWNLSLDNGVVVRLPEVGADKALAELSSLEASDKVIGKDILAIDLRLPDRVAFRLGADAAAARAEMLAKKKKGNPA